MRREQSKYPSNKIQAGKSTKIIVSSTEKMALHPRNKHRTRYDFDTLMLALPDLTNFVKPNAYGDTSIDFSDPQAVIALNKALLIQHYNILNWGIPAGYLCPPIPGRADYIHYLADLLNEFPTRKISHNRNVRVLDIGTGANIVYPLIGQREYGWQFVGVDIDIVALNNATNILNTNAELKQAIELRLQNSASAYFKGIINSSEIFDISMCNPPFYASQDEADAATYHKLHGLNAHKTKCYIKPTHNFGGQFNELICLGGEESFICSMIAESPTFSANIGWFTTLVSKSESLPAIYRALKNVNALKVKTIDMAQGQKKSRVVAWSFFNKTY